MLLSNRENCVKYCLNFLIDEKPKFDFFLRIQTIQSINQITKNPYSQETMNNLRQTKTSPSSASSTTSLSSGESDANSGWLSWLWSSLSEWIYGPNISLQDCLAYFFSADELKGDNMYSCEKCK